MRNIPHAAQVDACNERARRSQATGKEQSASGAPEMGTALTVRMRAWTGPAAHLPSCGRDGGDADAMRRLKRRLVYRRSPTRMRRGRYGCGARATGRGAVRCVTPRSLVAVAVAVGFAVRAILRTDHIFFGVSAGASRAVFRRAQCGRAARGVRRRAPRRRKPGSGPCALVHGLVLAQPVHREAFTPRQMRRCTREQGVCVRARV